jgi:hypothetical protein
MATPTELHDLFTVDLELDKYRSPHAKTTNQKFNPLQKNQKLHREEILCGKLFQREDLYLPY